MPQALFLVSRSHETLYSTHKTFLPSSFCCAIKQIHITTVSLNLNCVYSWSSRSTQATVLSREAKCLQVTHQAASVSATPPATSWAAIAGFALEDVPRENLILFSKQTFLADRRNTYFRGQQKYISDYIFENISTFLSIPLWTWFFILSKQYKQRLPGNQPFLKHVFLPRGSCAHSPI